MGWRCTGQLLLCWDLQSVFATLSILYGLPWTKWRGRKCWRLNCLWKIAMQRGCQDLQPSSCTAPTDLTYSSATELGKQFLFSSSISFPHKMCIFSRMSCWCYIPWEGRRIFWRAATRYSHDWTLQSFWPDGRHEELGEVVVVRLGWEGRLWKAETDEILGVADPVWGNTKASARCWVF